jgi:hypothetical protein
MAAEATLGRRRAARRARWFQWRAWQWVVLAVLVLVAAVVAAAMYIEEPVRRRMEAEINKALKGYTATVPVLELHPFRFSLTLRDPVVRQQAHPDPPVIAIETLHAGVHWRALLHLRLVADFTFETPRLHIDRRQLVAESKDTVDVEDKGWQDALEAIYPLKINKLVVSDGSLTYVDDDPDRPLEMTGLNLVTTNIRNISDPDEPYPSPLQLSAALFDKGRLQIDGEANYLAKPHPAIKADIDLKQVPLDRLKPVTTDVNVHIKGGILSAAGAVEYAPKRQSAHLRRARIDGISVDYVHSPQTAAAESQRVEKVRETATELADKPTVTVAVDALELRKATLGYVDETRNPHYRVFVSDATIDVRDISNQAEAGPGRLTAQGSFMGSGATDLRTTFAVRPKDPQMSIALKIENTDMRAMNDLFRAYGDFDVVDGRFSFFTELDVGEGRIEGYIKPLFTDMNVYDRRQDAGESLPHQIYEGLVGGIGELLENRRDDVATQADISGSTRSPDLSTLEVVANLIKNAFFKAILPRFEAAAANAPRKDADR